MDKLLQHRAKKARLHSNLNQSEAGKAIGISREAVSQWENGSTKSIKSELLHKVAKVYGVNSEWLATGEGTMLADSPTSHDHEYNKLSELTELEQLMVKAMRKLSEGEQKNLVSFALFRASDKDALSSINNTE